MAFSFRDKLVLLRRICIRLPLFRWANKIAAGFEILSMGIHQLAKVVGDNAPKAIKNGEIKSYFGRKVAIDASVCLYQFMVAVRSEGNNLTNEDGESTR